MNLRISGFSFVRIFMGEQRSYLYALRCTTLVDASSITVDHLLTCRHHQEDEILLCRTLYGVMKNIGHLVGASDDRCISFHQFD